MLRWYLTVAYPGLHVGPKLSIGPGATVRASDGGRLDFGANCAIAAGAMIIAEGGTIRFGDDCHIGTGAIIVARVAITIGSDALIAEYVTIRDHDHVTVDRTRPYRLQDFVNEPVTIGCNVWLGAKATVLMGATIGDNAVVGANAVVTGDVAAAISVGGIPARPLHRNPVLAPRQESP